VSVSIAWYAVLMNNAPLKIFETRAL